MELEFKFGSLIPKFGLEYNLESSISRNSQNSSGGNETSECSKILIYYQICTLLEQGFIGLIQVSEESRANCSDHMWVCLFDLPNSLRWAFKTAHPLGFVSVSFYFCFHPLLFFFFLQCFPAHLGWKLISLMQIVPF